jgi:tRNA pseudouridine38-40 synthase
VTFWTSDVKKAKQNGAMLNRDRPTVKLLLVFYTALAYVRGNRPVRYLARVSYDGSDYSGWQHQLKKRTIQGALNDVLSQYYCSDVKSVGASRTDKGVHARGQTIHFDLPQDYETADHVVKINNILPPAIKLYDLRIAPQGLLEIQRVQSLPWHAIENSISKNYSYRFTVAKQQNPFDYRYCSSVYDKNYPLIDIEKFRQCLGLFLGTHDFRAFGNKLDARAKLSEEYSGETFSSIRTIFSATLCKEHGGGYNMMPYEYLQRNIKDSSSSSLSGLGSGDCYRVDMKLDGALYKMIRNIIGACIAVSRGTMTTDQIRDLLDGTSSRTDSRIVTAPANGLCLESVQYLEGI